MSRNGFIIFMAVAAGFFAIADARADLGDFYFNKTQSLPQNYGHTAGMMLNPEGRGDVLIFPYYDIREINGKSQDFYFAIINKEGECGSFSAQCDMGVAAKLRFREWDKGEDVLDFDIWLSRGDVWVGALTHNTALALPYGARITSPDRIIIDFGVNTFTVATPFTTGFDFPIAAQIPPGSSNLMGYMEVIGEERTFDHQTGGKVTRLTTGNDAPNSLMGYAYIVRVADGSFFFYNAKAIANFSRNQGSLFFAPGSIFPDLTKGEDTLDELEFQIAKEGLVAGYSIEDALSGKTSLILTFPTKHFHFCGRPNYTIKGDVSAPCSSSYPLGAPWTARHANYPEVFSVNIFDRNENKLLPPQCPISPCPPVPAVGLPHEVNVIGLYKGIPPIIPSVGNRDTLGLSTQTFDGGYLTINFPNTGDVQSNNPKITNFLDLDLFLSSYEGLPVLGLSLQEFTNGNVGGFYGDLRDVFYNINWYPSTY